MMFVMSLAVGLLLGGVLFVALAPKMGDSGRRGVSKEVIGVVAVALGLAGIIDLTVSMFLRGTTVDSLMPLAIALPFAAVLFAAGNLVRGVRGWLIWLGLALGLAPALFWVVFVVAEVVGPPH